MEVVKIHEFSGHIDSIYTAALNPTLKILYTGGGEGIIAGWDAEGGGDGTIEAKVKTSVFSLCLDQQKIYIGGNLGNLFIVNLSTQKEERNIEAHRQAIFDIVVDTEADRIYTCGFDGSFKVWSKDFTLLNNLQLSSKSLRNICLIPGKIAIASSDNKIYILQRESLKVVGILDHHTNSVFALAFNPINNELLSGGRDCYIKIWDLNILQLKHEYIGATLHINHISLNPDHALYAVSSMDKTIKIFDAHTHEALKFINKERNDGHNSSVNKSLWLNNTTLYSVSDDKKAMGWSLK